MPAIPTNAVRTMPNAVPNFASVQPDQTGAALQKVGEVGYQIGGEMLQKAVTREEQDQQAETVEAFQKLQLAVSKASSGTRLAKDRAAKAISQVMIPEALDYPM